MKQNDVEPGVTNKSYFEKMRSVYSDLSKKGEMN
jgi:hypothetical protein